MKITPFRALRPSKEKVSDIASLPYDVMDTAEAIEMASGNPDSFLHVVRSEIDLPADIDPYDDEVYNRARKALERLRAEDKIVREDAPSIYIYRQTMGAHKQTAVVGCCDIDDYANGLILKHEKTRQDKEDDRTRHILTTNANTGQVFLTYRDVAAIDWIVKFECEADPIYDFEADDGVRHTVWRAVRTTALSQMFATVPKVYIADGHHRSAASYRAGAERRKAAGANADPAAEYNRFMACLFPASQLQILPYNRCVKDLNGLSPEAFMAKVREVFEVTEIDEPEVNAPTSCAMYFDKKWYRLSWDVPADIEDPVSRLDVSWLQDHLLSPVLGINDPRTDERIFFVGGIRGNAELISSVDSGNASVAFSMYPTTVEQMMEIADAGQTMPPKSTWFEPKLRSGLLIHTLD
ncbi:MAG: DUF1015 domain-containing protein [Lentisphaerae bacterium]|nr:DUF1015 domain-containing protein [Lentisphaerota bacterium]